MIDCKEKVEINEDNTLACKCMMVCWMLSFLFKAIK